jgi:sarcosine oxidase
MQEQYDVIVVGLGAVGAATLYQLAQRGRRVLGIDRYAPPHEHGSSHGETRITRLAVGEGAEYVPLVARSHEIWRDIEARTGRQLLLETGALVVGTAGRAAPMHGRGDFVGETIALAERFGIHHEVLDASSLARRFPQLALRGDEVGYYEPDGGVLRPEACVAAQIALARTLGAEVRTDTRVTRVEAVGNGDAVEVRTPAGALIADEVVLAAGPWLSELVPDEAAAPLGVYRQVLYWFDVEASYGAFVPERFPIFIWVFGAGAGDFLYGFPALDGPRGGLKVGAEQFVRAAAADDVARAVDETEIRAMFDAKVRDRLRAVGARCLRTATCLYTNTPDRGFIVDRHPRIARVLYASACSGHGFKHSAALGEAIAEGLCEGRSRIDLAPFAASRFAGA